MISVIVPVYKTELYIDRCLESIVNQTYKDLEIILINDGSPDKCGEIIEIWKKKDNRIITIHQENSGLSVTRNVGLDLAKGEEIVFIDSDDIMAEDMCERLHRLLNDFDAQVAICELKHIFNEEDISFDNENGQTIVFSPKEAVIDMWYQKTIIPSACGRIYKRSIFDKIRFKENIIFEDVEIMPGIFDATNKIVYNSAQLYGYCHHKGSITTNPFSKKDLGILNIAYNNYQLAQSKDIEYVNAARSYYVVAALRIFLNASEEYQDDIKKSKEIIDRYGKSVSKDKQIKKKLKYSLLLYFYARPLLKIVYRRINRWK